MQPQLETRTYVGKGGLLLLLLYRMSTNCKQIWSTEQLVVLIAWTISVSKTDFELSWTTECDPNEMSHLSVLGPDIFEANMTTSGYTKPGRRRVFVYEILYVCIYLYICLFKPDLSLCSPSGYTKRGMQLIFVCICLFVYEILYVCIYLYICLFEPYMRLRSPSGQTKPGKQCVFVFQCQGICRHSNE